MKATWESALKESCKHWKGKPLVLLNSSGMHYEYLVYKPTLDESACRDVEARYEDYERWRAETTDEEKAARYRSVREEVERTRAKFA
jgi:hypothetical protein